MKSTSISRWGYNLCCHLEVVGLISSMPSPQNETRVELFIDNKTEGSDRPRPMPDVMT
jgi:hypothetical protein